MTKLQEIVKKAKALKKAYPNKYSKWTDYVKAASKLVSKSKTVGAVKKTATKKTATRSTHKDTRSHNVNVKVVSGVKSYKNVTHYDVRDRMEKDLQKLLHYVNYYKNARDRAKGLPISERKEYLAVEKNFYNDFKQLVLLKEKELRIQNKIIRSIERAANK